MKSLNQTYAQPLPTGLELPLPSAMLYGYVDATETGYRRIGVGATTYTLPSGIHRADALPALLDSVSGGAFSTQLSNSIYTVFPDPAATLTATDRLAVLMGLAERAGVTTTGTSSEWNSSRIPPIAIPLAGYYVTQQRIEADDERISDRLERDMGYVWEGARVVTVRMTLHKWALDAWFFGWCQRGKVSVVGSQTSPLGSSLPGGAVTGRVISAGLPRYVGEAKFWAEVDLVLAVEGL